MSVFPDTIELKTKATRSRRPGKEREQGKKTGPTVAAKELESSEKYDKELLKEDEEVGRRREEYLEERERIHQRC